MIRSDSATDICLVAFATITASVIAAAPIIYDGKRINVSNLMNILRKRGQFTDTVIDGQIYQTVKVMTYIPSLRDNVSIVINAKDDTKYVHVLCTDLQEDVSTIFRYAKKRVMIENSYKDAKQLGLESIGSERAKRRLYTRT